MGGCKLGVQLVGEAVAQVRAQLVFGQDNAGLGGTDNGFGSGDLGLRELFVRQCGQPLSQSTAGGGEQLLPSGEQCLLDAPVLVGLGKFVVGLLHAVDHVQSHVMNAEFGNLQVLLIHSDSEAALVDPCIPQQRLPNRDSGEKLVGIEIQTVPSPNTVRVITPQAVAEPVGRKPVRPALATSDSAS